jgi:hypothetical protein
MLPIHKQIFETIFLIKLTNSRSGADTECRMIAKQVTAAVMDSILKFSFA